MSIPTKQRTPLRIDVVRGAVIESSHEAMAAVVNDRGFITGFHGNVDFVVYPRSAIKMLQAIPFVESGAMEKFGLGEEMLALACSSHHAEPEHLEVAKRWMEKIGVQDSIFRHGPAKPGGARVTNNCSGKHLGFISTALVKGEEPGLYWHYDHPVQARVRKVMTDLTKIDHEKTPSGLDGCGIPTYVVPLQNMAGAIGHLISAPTSPVRKAAVARIVAACRAHPLLLGGKDDFVTLVNQRTKGRVVLKSGAEGTYAGFSSEPGLAFVVKVHDGAKRAAEVATAHILREHKLLTDSECADLKSWFAPEIKNTLGEKTGEIHVRKGG